jgi:8-oxo-dGTP pyrophosphatase MutT (NUDIX family)
VDEADPGGGDVQDVTGYGARMEADRAGPRAWPGPVRYDGALRDRVTANLAAHARREAALDGRLHAAVALVLVKSVAGGARTEARRADGTPIHDPALLGEGLDRADGGAAFLLCRRPPRLRRHGGQYALPGGRLDPGEDPVTAALRETEEEVGLRLGEEDVLGLMDDYGTRSGFVMTPVVLWAGGAGDLRPDPGEVQAVFRVGLHHLLREDSPRFTRIPQSERPVVELVLGEEVVHAPTAAVVLQLGWLGLQGRTDPVHHFEQPVFAWR